MAVIVTNKNFLVLYIIMRVHHRIDCLDNCEFEDTNLLIRSPKIINVIQSSRNE